MMGPFEAPLGNPHPNDASFREVLYAGFGKSIIGWAETQAGCHGVVYTNGEGEFWLCDGADLVLWSRKMNAGESMT